MPDVENVGKSMNFLDDSWTRHTRPMTGASGNDSGHTSFWLGRFDRSGGRVLASTGSGLWEVREDRWVQRRDETLTEVDVIDDGDRMIAASAYGIGFGKTEPSGATHWDWLSD